MYIYLVAWIDVNASCHQLVAGWHASRSDEVRARPLMLKNIELSVIIRLYSALVLRYGLKVICNHIPCWIHGSMPIETLLF